MLFRNIYESLIMKYFAIFCCLSCTLFGLEIDIFNPQSFSTTVEKSPFRGPRGERGDRGHRGHKGDRGSRGKQGKRGPKGTDASVAIEFANIPCDLTEFDNTVGGRLIKFNTPYQATPNISLQNDLSEDPTIISFAPEGYGRYVGRMMLWVSSNITSPVTLFIKANDATIDSFTFNPLTADQVPIMPVIFTFEASNTSNELKFAIKKNSGTSTVYRQSRLVLHKIDELKNT